MYTHQHYPSFRFHSTLPPVVVNDPAEDDALGEGWADSPAAFAPMPGPGPLLEATEGATEGAPEVATPEATPAAAPAPKPRRKK